MIGIPAKFSLSDGLTWSSFFAVITPSYGNGWRKGKPFAFRCTIQSTLSFIRNYPLKKIQENNEAEIMEVVLDEARSSYTQEIVIELQSEDTEDLESNVGRIVQWIGSWRVDNACDQSKS